MDVRTVEELRDAIHTREPVSGLTHDFYRYPARFSPNFVRAAIAAFSSPGDVVLDPFMGGATTAVEARIAGRAFVGADVNSLAVFLARAKTAVLSEGDIEAVESWIDEIASTASLHRPPLRDTAWIERGYQRNISGRQTWPIRKTIEFFLGRISDLRPGARQLFARAVLLKTAQWALDCRSDVPPAVHFRSKLVEHARSMSIGARAFRNAVPKENPSSLFLHRSAAGIENDSRVRAHDAPHLILTSPPYPGVHVIYHRWQVLGRKETPAPFWIANSMDGNGLSHYTFGDRKRPTLNNYFENLRVTFGSLATLANANTTIVQMVAFSDPSWQLVQYLETLHECGLREELFPALANHNDGRIWRAVPNRKWYADQRGSIAASSEVVLFHRKG